MTVSVEEMVGFDEEFLFVLDVGLFLDDVCGKRLLLIGSLVSTESAKHPALG